MNFTGTSNFTSNSALQGGAISANSDSTITFNRNISFTNNGHNTGDSSGGAMYLAIDSSFSIFSNTTVCLENNHANLGGAIYVFNANPLTYCTFTRISYFLPREKCFFQFYDQNDDVSININAQLIFKNNSADAAGSVLYGGAIDDCELFGSMYPYSSSRVFNMLIQYEDDKMTSSISSDPFRVCLCENNSPNCNKLNETLSVYPGETVQVSVVAIGQRDGIVPAAVRSHIDKGRLQSSQYIQQTTKVCTTLNYTVFSQQNVTIELYPDGQCSTVSDKLFFWLNVSQSCPLGFNMNPVDSSCVCGQTLQKYTNNCNIENGLGKITRVSDDTFWVGYDPFQRLVIVHPHCPIHVDFAHSFWSL